MYSYLSYSSKRKILTASYEDNIKTDLRETRWLCVCEWIHPGQDKDHDGGLLPTQ